MDIISSTLMETEGLNYAKVEAILFRNLCRIMSSDIAVFFLCDPSNSQLILKKTLPALKNTEILNESYSISSSLYRSIIDQPIERLSDKYDFYHEIIPENFSNRIKKSSMNWYHVSFSFGGSPIAVALVHITKKIETGLIKSFLHISALILQRSFAFSNLRKTRLELSSVYGSISDIILLIDHNLRILWTNKLGQYYFGNHISGNIIYQVLTDGTVQTDDRILRALFHERVNKEFERTVITSDGKKKSYQCVASVAGNGPDGDAEIGVIIFKDITSQKRQKNNLLLLNDKVNRCQKALIRQRSHNILGKLYSEMYKELSQGIYNTNENLSKLEELSNQLLKLSNIDSNEKAAFLATLKDLKDSFRFSETLENSFHNLVYIKQVQREINPYYLNQSVAEIISLITSLRSGKIKCKQEYGEVPVLNAMGVEVNVAIYEMLNNAVESLLYPYEQKDAEIQIETWSDKEWAYLKIIHNGPKLEAENMLSIFDFFQSSKHHVTGIGVGMTVINEYIVNRHNGNLSLDTQREHGASFTLSLPL